VNRPGTVTGAPPELGLEPERRLSDVEERERSGSGDSRPAKLGGRERRAASRRSGVVTPFCRNKNRRSFIPSLPRYNN